MESDELSIFDVENGILSGEIVERQKDHDTDAWKYLVAGKTLDESDIIVVGKISSTDKLVIIPIFLEKKINSNEIIWDVCGTSGARIIRVTKSCGKGIDLLLSRMCQSFRALVAEKAI